LTKVGVCFEVADEATTASGPASGSTDFIEVFNIGTLRPLNRHDGPLVGGPVNRWG
jgi:hypothetical protein